MQRLRKKNLTQVVCYSKLILQMTHRCEYQNEIQSALWSLRSVNLFTAVTYNAKGKEEFFLIVTNSPDKGENSVCTFMLKLVDGMIFKDERELIFFSDGVMVPDDGVWWCDGASRETYMEVAEAHWLYFLPIKEHTGKE